jgi:hypothetical protein
VSSYSYVLLGMTLSVLPFSKTPTLPRHPADELSNAMRHTASDKPSRLSAGKPPTDPSELQLKARSPSILPLLQPRPRPAQIESAGAMIVQIPRGILLVGVLVWHVPYKVVLVVVDA